MKTKTNRNFNAIPKSHRNKYHQNAEKKKKDFVHLYIGIYPITIGNFIEFVSFVYSECQYATLYQL